MVKSTVNGSRREALFKGQWVIANLEDCMVGLNIQGDDNSKLLCSPIHSVSHFAVGSLPCGRC